MKNVQISKKYYICEDGKVYRIKDDSEFKINSITEGYYCIRYKGKRHYIHHIVMELFGPPRPGPEYQIDHKNQNRLDNRIENLRWVTATENQNNRTNNRPIGKRLCDFDNINDYKRICNAESRAKRRERRKSTLHKD